MHPIHLPPQKPALFVLLIAVFVGLPGANSTYRHNPSSPSLRSSETRLNRHENVVVHSGDATRMFPRATVTGSDTETQHATVTEATSISKSHHEPRLLTSNNTSVSPSPTVATPSPAVGPSPTPSPQASPIPGGNSSTSPLPSPLPPSGNVTTSPIPSGNGTSPLPSPVPGGNGTNTTTSPSASPSASPSGNVTYSPLPSPSANTTVTPSPSPSPQAVSPLPSPSPQVSPSPAPASPSPSPVSSASPVVSPVSVPLFNPDSFYVDELQVGGRDGFTWFLTGPLGDATLLVMVALGTPPVNRPLPSPKSLLQSRSRFMPHDPSRYAFTSDDYQVLRRYQERVQPLYAPGQIYGTPEECLKAIQTVNSSIAAGYFYYDQINRMFYVLDTPSSGLPLGEYNNYVSASDAKVIQRFIERAAQSHNPILYTSNVTVSLPSPSETSRPSPTPVGTGFRKRVGLSIVIPVASGSLVMGIILAFTLIYIRHRRRVSKHGYINFDEQAAIVS